MKRLQNNVRARKGTTLWVALGIGFAGAMTLASLNFTNTKYSVLATSTHSPAQTVVPPTALPRTPASPSTASLSWRLNNPMPHITRQEHAQLPPAADKFAARVRAMDERALLRAYEGAPPTIPHSISDLAVATCTVCHSQGLLAGGKVARMIAHTSMTNCTQCHVETTSPQLGDAATPLNMFTGLRSSGYGGTRAYAGAPPVIPHATFMRTNCVSCHGEHGYDGWRPDHLGRSNCIQCHAPAAEFDQLAPTFGISDVPDGNSSAPAR